MTALKYAKFIKSLLVKSKTTDVTALQDHYNLLVALEKLTKNYLKLRRLAKNYVRDDHLGNARKLRDELEIEQWW